MYQFGLVTGGLTPLKLTSERQKDNMTKDEEIKKLKKDI